MTVTIELSPEVEAGLAALAAANGLALSRYVRQVLEEKVPGRGRTPLSLAEQAGASSDIKDLTPRPLLPDSAIGRDTIYDARG